jgi:HK97 family phage prohead protease|nr:MAG TPA: prohead serine protease [Caudoviricetes sp.]
MQKEKAQQTITRAYNFELRAKNDEAHGTYIEGRPIVYGSMTDLGYFNEIIEPGALTDTDLKDVRFLVNHNTDMIPLARSRRNNDNSTMQMVVDEKGMSIRVNLDVENNTDAKNLYSAVKRGDISGMSFMFSVDNEEWEDLESEHPTRYIKKIGQVLEVSAVTFPAYEATEISARAKETLDSVKSTLDSVRAQSIKNDNANDVELEKLKAHYLYDI